MKDYYFYKIVCNDLHVQHTYVGSTENFTIRKNVHKYDSTNPKRNHIKIYTTMAEHGGWSNWEMVLIEKRGFETRLEAKKLERYYYEQLNSDISLNTIYPQRDRKEYLQTNKESLSAQQSKRHKENKISINARHKNNYENNKESVAARQKNYYENNKELFTDKHKCVCGGCYTRQNLSKHMKTNKHLEHDINFIK